MQISVKGKTHLKNQEGFRAKPYICAAGKLTVGYGFRISAEEGEHYKATPMTREQAEVILDKKIAAILVVIGKTIRQPLTQGQVDALIAFIFNIGVEAFKTSTLVRKINSRNYAGAADEFPRWCHGDHGVIIPGLVTRRAKEKAMFLGKE